METSKKKKSETKFTRTQSSLIRFRSSIDFIISSHHEDELVDEKKNKPNCKTGSTRFITAPVLFFFIFCSSILYYFFFYLGASEETPTSENVLLVLIFVAIVLYFANKNKGMIQKIILVLKHSWDMNLNRRGFYSKCGNNTEPVKWYIGDSGESENSEVEEEEKDELLLVNRVEKEGVEFYSNGDFYEGEFHRKKCNGSGVYHYFVSGRYEGDWVDGKYDGYGIEIWARGSRYKGQYRKGLRHGYGVYMFYTGDSYSGEWFNGQSHGFGVQNCSDASSYVGEFNFGVKHGLGCYHFRNGDRYSGEYFGDKIHGFGVYHFANGHRYEGAWHEGRRQGYGVYIFRNGERKCGEWDAGNLKHSLPRLTDAILRAVQAARKTAENAINLRRKDDEVNKAVIAASRAATAARVAAVKAVQNRMGGKFCDTDV
ncbi:unnamed protein product [Lupinus luteus]|uniref:Uncharacterized protein n=1 Tax=Lupinus luteus TaxID=3873 RepID=A0AAV1WER7_LUPLU